MPLKTFHVQHFYSLQEEHQAEAADQILMRGLGTAMVLAVVLCATVLQGFPMFKRGRCLCISPGVKAVRVADIEKATIIYPSNSCNKIEVIITLKARKGQRCLNPKSKQAKVIIRKLRE
ncbi:C-X-C motif chemokine 11 [Manis pentadactyla]|uniref:C-X-C motif chemokine 11 n=1 Tax=Manis pentadactyla TaxID=143292 RepID=UPI001875BE71|nr:C-X-C motif chemokine 11 [Manis pentadactyla]KAI5278827.1 C-X-C Motif Chemokine 11 [Manis pentadactyla]